MLGTILVVNAPFTVSHLPAVVITRELVAHTTGTGYRTVVLQGSVQQRVFPVGAIRRSCPALSIPETS